MDEEATIEKCWSSITKEEPIQVEKINSTIYGYSSELGVLRLFYYFRNRKDARIDYSENMKTWFFAIY